MPQNDMPMMPVSPEPPESGYNMDKLKRIRRVFLVIVILYMSISAFGIILIAYIDALTALAFIIDALLLWLIYIGKGWARVFVLLRSVYSLINWWGRYAGYVLPTYIKILNVIVWLLLISMVWLFATKGFVEFQEYQRLRRRRDRQKP